MFMDWKITCTLVLDVIDIGRSPHSGCVWIFCKKFIEKTNSNPCWDTGKMFIWIFKGFKGRMWENLRNVLESQILSNSILIFSTTIHIIKILNHLSSFLRTFLVHTFTNVRFFHILFHCHIQLLWHGCLWVLCFNMDVLKYYVSKKQSNYLG
jgi:hypothetical protein